jgi:hypothetical protein
MSTATLLLLLPKKATSYMPPCWPQQLQQPHIQQHHCSTKQQRLRQQVQHCHSQHLKGKGVAGATGLQAGHRQGTCSSVTKTAAAGTSNMSGLWTDTILYGIALQA